MDKNITTKKLNQEFFQVINKIPGGIARFTFQDRFRLLYANVGFFEMMGFSEECYAINFGQTYGMSVDLDEGEKIKNLFDNRQKHERLFKIEYQHKMPDQSVKWISLQAECEADINGKVIFNGIFMDITNVKQSDNQRNMESQEYNLVRRLSGELLFEYNIQTQTMKQISLLASETDVAEQFIPLYRDTILKKQKIFSDDIEIFLQMCDRFDCGAPLIEAELRLSNEHGQYVWCKIQAATIYDKTGKAIKVMGKMENIDQQKRETESLKEQSRRDPLTSFYNKIVIEEAIEEYFALEGDKAKCAFMVIDIDNFKAINDTQGHLFGDAVLIDIAEELKTVFRATDLIGRIGGDEFVALMKNVDSIEVIEQKARDICRTFRDLYAGKDHQQQISCSIGICLYPEHGKTYRELFAKADQSLYATKGFRKDDFTIYGTEEKRTNYPMLDQDDGSLQRDDHYFACTVPAKKKLSLIRIFELLFDTKDIQRGINMVLDVVGDYYELDRVYILETMESGQNLHITYEWCQTGVLARKLTYQGRAFHGVPRETLFFCEDVATAPLAEGVRTRLEKCGVKALLQYALYENGKFNGTIVFEDCKQTRKWREEEIESLLIIAKFIGSYLVKMHAQDEVEKLAYTDPLTGMWNLNKFKIVAAKMLAPLETGDDKHYALICFDIKKFRYINDTFGFEVGDKILMYVANCLKSVLTNEMIFARMSADKFLVLVRYKVIERLLRSLNVVMQKSQYFVSAKTGRYKLIFSLGLYLIHQGNLASINLMIDKADIARSKAHRGHVNNYVFYNETFRQKLLQEKEIEDLVDYALTHKEFVVYYQPKIDLLTGKNKGAEALVRWVSPTKGFMSPAEFIPLFEKNGFIAKLDFYVFERVFSDLRRWMDEKRTIVPISVNLSRVHLSDGSFIERLMALSRKYDISPSLIEIELTEGVFMENISSIIEVMHELKKIGFLISIDDFGSGYSSLRLLRDLPVDYLKLDKEFLDKGDSNIREQIIIMNVIRMAKTLGIKVVSEGVETATQATFLKSCACDLVQGFLYARPMPVEKFEKTLLK